MIFQSENEEDWSDRVIDSELQAKLNQEDAWEKRMEQKKQEISSNIKSTEALLIPKLASTSLNIKSTEASPKLKPTEVSVNIPNPPNKEIWRKFLIQNNDYPNFASSIRLQKDKMQNQKNKPVTIDETFSHIQSDPLNTFSIEPYKINLICIDIDSEITGKKILDFFSKKISSEISFQEAFHNPLMIQTKRPNHLHLYYKFSIELKNKNLKKLWPTRLGFSAIQNIISQNKDLYENFLKEHSLSDKVNPNYHTVNPDYAWFIDYTFVEHFGDGKNKKTGNCLFLIEESSSRKILGFKIFDKNQTLIPKLFAILHGN